MSPAARLAESSRINYLNIGLILISFGVALFVPFELFLFAYSVLGPAHYLTEISWLQKRQFFTKSRWDGWMLTALAILLFFALPFTSGQMSTEDQFRTTAIYTALALGSALVFLLTPDFFRRALGLVAVAVVVFATVNTSVMASMMVALFVPSLIHVYVFTGFFMLYGSLKERSRSGYLTFGVFLACPLLFLFLEPGRAPSAGYVIDSYWKHFSTLNTTLLGLAAPRTVNELREVVQKVFNSGAGLKVMRFIAFAYTYHYLNWFSKTSVIKWHEVPVKRMAFLGVLWLASVGLYAYDYTLGFKVLFCLSFMHLYLEFPLNHLSIIGTFRELQSALGLRTLAPAAVAAPAVRGKQKG